MNTRRTRILSLHVAEDGTVDLPVEAAIVSLEFEGEGPYGYRTRPVTAWAVVPAESVD